MRFIFASEDGTEKFVIKADDYKDKKVHEVTKRIKKNVNYNVSSSGDKKDTGNKGKGVEQGLMVSLEKIQKKKILARRRKLSLPTLEIQQMTMMICRSNVHKVYSLHQIKIKVKGDLPLL